MSKDNDAKNVVVARRFVGERAEMGDDNKLHLLASTADAVDWGGWREILVHEEGSIDFSAATALLVNHDPNQIAGRISNPQIRGSELHLDAEPLPGAKLATGVEVAEAVRSGALRGVSIGYQYSRDNVEWNEKTREAKVRKWRLLEASLTPIPADGKAGVRSVPFDLSDQPADPNAAKQKEERMSEPVENGQPQPEVADIEKLKRDAEAAKAEAALAKTENKVRALAVKYGVSADDIDFKDEAKAIETLLERKAKTEEAKPKASVVVTRDAGDKFIEGASKGLVGDKDGIHMSAVELVRRCAALDGERMDDASPLDLAGHAVRRASYSKRDANKITSSFSTLLNNTANKQILGGFDRYNTTYEQFCTIKDAVNFNSKDHNGVSTGRLIETAEGVAFPELTQKEGTYSSALKMWGASVSVSMQAIVNDELGEIMRDMFRAGYAAKRTVERQVYYKLLNATWSNDTSSSAAIGTSGNLDKVRAALKGKLSPAGEKLELDPRLVLVDSLNRLGAELATGTAYGIASGANAQIGSGAVRGMGVVDSTFVGDTALYGSAATTDYYLFADPNMVDTVVVEFLRGQRQPTIQEFDPGAVAAINYKIMLPFQATVATYTDSAGNARIAGIQKATA